MYMPFTGEAIAVTIEEGGEVEQMRRARAPPAGDGVGGWAVFMSAEGFPVWVLLNKVDVSAPTLSRWKERFLEQRLEGLMEIRHPGQKPSVITPAWQAKVLEVTRRKPKDGSTHWSCRKLAAHLGVSKDTVQRLWHKAR